MRPYRKLFGSGWAHERESTPVLFPSGDDPPRAVRKRVREEPLADRLWEEADMSPAEFGERWGR